MEQKAAEGAEFLKKILGVKVGGDGGVMRKKAEGWSPAKIQKMEEFFDEMHEDDSSAYWNTSNKPMSDQRTSKTAGMDGALAGGMRGKVYKRNKMFRRRTGEMSSWVKKSIAAAKKQNINVTWWANGNKQSCMAEASKGAAHDASAFLVLWAACVCFCVARMHESGAAPDIKKPVFKSEKHRIEQLEIEIEQHNKRLQQGVDELKYKAQIQATEKLMNQFTVFARAACSPLHSTEKESNLFTQRSIERAANEDGELLLFFSLHFGIRRVFWGLGEVFDVFHLKCAVCKVRYLTFFDAF